MESSTNQNKLYGKARVKFKYASGAISGSICKCKKDIFKYLKFHIL